jgi:hypothetical protein
MGFSVVAGSIRGLNRAGASARPDAPPQRVARWRQLREHTESLRQGSSDFSVATLTLSAG